MSHFTVGLTGGIGSGKTAVSDAFARRGIDIVDADIIARDVVAPGSEGLSGIVDKFGQSVLHTDGTLNRTVLRDKVFHSESDKQWLNQLLHPLIRTAMMAAVDGATSPYCILSVPLLIENKLTPMVDRVLVVDCPETLQLSRAMARDGSSESTIRNIMASQADRDSRLAAADDIIDNSGTLDELECQVARLHQDYLRAAKANS